MQASVHKPWATEGFMLDSEVIPNMRDVGNKPRALPILSLFAAKTNSAKAESLKLDN